MTTTRKKPRKTQRQTRAERPRTGASTTDPVDTSAPLTQSALAALRGVSRQAVSKAVREGGALHAALLPGGRVDAGHTAVVAWLESAAPVAPAATTPGPAEPEGDTAAMLSGDAELAGDLRARTEAAVARFGSLAAYVAAAQADRLDADRAIARRRDAALAGRLIPREPVRAFVFGALDRMTRILLADFSQTAATRLHQHFAAGGSVADARTLIADLLGAHLRAGKDQSLAALDRIEPDASPPEVRAPERRAVVVSVPPSFVRALELALAELAPSLVESTARQLARHAAGSPFSNAVFDAALALLSPVRVDAESRARQQLAAALRTTISRFAIASSDRTEAPSP